MGSMFYCAFYNAANDIRNKLEVLESEGESIEGDELEAAKEIIELAQQLENYFLNYNDGF